jgi:hypothetical protein
MLAIVARAGDHAAEKSKSRARQKVLAVARVLPRRNGRQSQMPWRTLPLGNATE